jgi:arylsulfatase
MKGWKLWQLAALALASGALCGVLATGPLAAGVRSEVGEPAAGDKAPETTPPPGSPAATQSPESRYLPFPQFPEVKFGGKIGINAGDSKPFWTPKVVPPKGAPNVLLIMTDDVGFGAPSTFGGVIPTPTMDRLAKMGLRYNKLHSTALCSPTRAAIMTGRNHHACHFGVIAEISTGYPGYDSMLDGTTATIAAILRQYGYATGWWGKNHNTPDGRIPEPWRRGRPFQVG